MNKQVYNLEEHQDAIGQLLEFQGSTLSAQFLADYNAGKTKILNSTSVFRKMVEPAPGTQQLIDADTRKKVGVSSFSETVLSDSEVLIIDKIRLNLDRHKDAGKEALLAYDKVISSSPAFRNADFRMRQEGKIVFDSSLSELSNKYTGRTLRDDYIYLTNPIVLVGGSDIKFELEFAPGATKHATQKEYLEFIFAGQKVTR
ncbi:hypothetical protein V2595_07020 [Tenacibaculum maritimum]|uniref:hypothetical protein n=1 Tax=Tenacibaculum maritimum TaxID=107401 RepID=UPI003876808C